jgi:hypothetical protein
MSFDPAHALARLQSLANHVTVALREAQEAIDFLDDRRQRLTALTLAGLLQSDQKMASELVALVEHDLRVGQ